MNIKRPNLIFAYPQQYGDGFDVLYLIIMGIPKISDQIADKNQSKCQNGYLQIKSNGNDSVLQSPPKRSRGAEKFIFLFAGIAIRNKSEG